MVSIAHVFIARLLDQISRSDSRVLAKPEKLVKSFFISGHFVGNSISEDAKKLSIAGFRNSDVHSTVLPISMPAAFLFICFRVSGRVMFWGFGVDFFLYIYFIFMKLLYIFGIRICPEWAVIIL